MIQVLQIVSTSWQIAFIVVGLATAGVVWRLFNQGMKYSHEDAKEHRARVERIEAGNRAKLVNHGDD